MCKQPKSQAWNKPGSQHGVLVSELLHGTERRRESARILLCLTYHRNFLQKNKAS